MTSPQAAQLQLGWEYASVFPEPGPPPRRPTPPDAARLSPDWAAAQRRQESQLNRPLQVIFCAAAGLGVLLAVLGAAGSFGPFLTGLAVTCCALVAAVSGYGLWQGERALRSRLAEERARIARARQAQESELFAWQAEHATQMQAWQARQLAYAQQKRWYAVRLPDPAMRVDIAGGTPGGWSAMLTTAAAGRLAAGGEVTVLDLTGSAVALDLTSLARACGSDPLVWVLPGDLPRLHLTGGLGRDALADLLSAVAAASGEPELAGGRRSLDQAILERVIGVLGGQPAIASVAAGLRALAQAAEPADDVAAGLITAAQAAQLTALSGRAGSDRTIPERAWILESHLRKLASAGAGTGAGTGPLPHRDLRVIALDRRVGTASSRVLGTYLTVALSHLLPQTPGPAGHTLFVLGADKLPGDVLDRLGDACDRSAAGLVLAYRQLPAPIRPRLGRGHAVLAVMRLEDSEDAAVAAGLLGAGISGGGPSGPGPRLALAQLTETVGGSITDPASGTYTSNTGEAGGAGPGRLDDGDAVRAEIRTSTGWGMATAKATADGDSLARALERSREILAGPDEIRQLPVSAMIVSYPGPDGRQLVLADVNPGIGGLAAATGLTLAEFRARPPGPVAPAEADGPAPAGPAAVPDRPGPNLGPPPRRLDWRRGRG